MAMARDLGVLAVHLGLGIVVFIGWIGRIGPCRSKRSGNLGN